MGRLSKEERKRRLREVKQAEQDAFADSMPMSSSAFLGLLDWLDVEIEACDHTTKLTEQYLREQDLDAKVVLAWLAQYGGYCDCEVFNNLYDLSEQFRPEPTPPTPSKRRSKKPRSLQVAAGWDLEALPKPWRLANLYNEEGPLTIQLGKREGCAIAVIESPLPDGDQAADGYWRQLWYERTELPERQPPVVTRDVLEIPESFRSVLVATTSWLPVYCWAVPRRGTWYLEVRSELQRQGGDLPQVAKLITLLESRGAPTRR